MCWRKWISYISQRSIPKRRPGPQVTRLTHRLKPQQVRRSPTAQSPRLELKTWLQVDQRYGNLVENWLLKKKTWLITILYMSLYMSICFASSNSMVFWVHPFVTNPWRLSPWDPWDPVPSRSFGMWSLGRWTYRGLVISPQGEPQHEQQEWPNPYPM